MAAERTVAALEKLHAFRIALDRRLQAQLGPFQLAHQPLEPLELRVEIEVLTGVTGCLRSFLAHGPDRTLRGVEGLAGTARDFCERRPGRLASPGRSRDTRAVPPWSMPDSSPPREFPAPDQEHLAAVDLGSNSFHLIIAREIDGGIQVLDRIKETVRLAAGLDDEKRLSGESRDRALQCLARFGARLNGIPEGRVRAVGTNTIRNAKNARGFLRRARAALGHDIEVLPGAEEARLVYLGVAHDLADDGGRRLVVDIGGGSTELVIGERFGVFEADSVQMGCVTFSRRFFENGRLSRRAFERARIAARVELLSIEDRFKATGFAEAVGSSGTANAVATILEQNGWSPSGITRSGLGLLENAVVEAGRIEDLVLPGLSEDRRPVIAGGIAVLSAVFDALELETMAVSNQALREGLLYDLIGRIHHEDVRDSTISALQNRYAVDLEQAQRVGTLASRLLEQVHDPWELEPERSKLTLGYAAALHEVGLALRHSGHHKHGSYLLAYSDLPGFSADEQRFLSVLVRTHRRKLTRTLFAVLPSHQVRDALRLAVLLRLAVCVCRSRAATIVPEVSLIPRRGRLDLQFADSTLDERPLLRADLEVEQRYLKGIGFELEIRSEPR